MPDEHQVQPGVAAQPEQAETLRNRKTMGAKHNQVPDVVSTDPRRHRPPRRFRARDSVCPDPIARVPEREQQILGQSGRGQHPGGRMHGHHPAEGRMRPQQRVGESGVVVDVAQHGQRSNGVVVVGRDLRGHLRRHRSESSCQPLRPDIFANTQPSTS